MGNVFTNNSSISNGIWTSMGSNNIMNDEELREQIYDKLKSDKRADTYVIPTRVMDTIVEFIQTEMAEAESRASEIFIPVKGYEGVYEVSNTGKVRSLPRKTSKGGELKQATVQGGYKRVSLSNGSRKGYTVHRLVGMAFLSNPLNKPCINHIDGNPSNNNVSNLEWCTYAENSQHSFNVLGQKPWNKDFGQYRTSPCKQCGKDYTVRETRWTQEYCSKGCATSSRYTKEGA